MSLVKDIYPGLPGSLFTAPGSPARERAVVGGKLFFTANSLADGGLWVSDGTEAGTVGLRLPNAGVGQPSELTNVSGTLFFAGNDLVTYHGIELWKSDGTEAGTVLVKDVNTVTTSYGSNSIPRNLTNVGGVLYFVADDGSHGKELWKSDGTDAGTVLVKDINMGSGSGFNYPYGTDLGNLTNVNGVLYFAADDGTHGLELWKSDGTAAGTVMVKDVNPGTPSAFTNFGIPENVRNINGTVYFTANDGTHGLEMWKSDGTDAGTVMVKDINPGASGSRAAELTLVNGTIFFTANNGTDLLELWKTDGTETGTVMVKDINSAFYTSSAPSRLTNVSGTLFFTADDGISGMEVWKSDGTTAGTVLLKDIMPGNGPHNPGNLINVSGTLFFSATDDRNGSGYELWQSDGTTAGTVMVADINPHINAGGYYGSNPRYFSNVSGTLFFRANDGTHGIELWSATVSGGGTTDTTGTQVMSATFLGAGGTFDRVRFTFSEAIDASSFVATDVTLAGPGGAIAVTGIAAVAGSNNTQFEATFALQSIPGMYTVRAGPDILDAAGNQLDQNLNGTNGEGGFSPIGDEFQGSGSIPLSPPLPLAAVGFPDGTVSIIDTSRGSPLVTGLRLMDAPGSQYKGLVQVAMADLNHDGTDDLFLSAANPSGAAGLDPSKAGKVFAFDGASAAQTGIPTLMRTFTPFATTDGPAGNTNPYVNGLNVAVADVNGDGTVDVIAGTRGGNGTPTGGNREVGRVVVIDGTGADGTNTVIGGIQKPFGGGYEKGVVVAAGDTDGTGRAEVAVTRGGPVASPNPAVQRIKLKVFELRSGALTELPLNADGTTSFAPFAALTGPANAITRDGRVAFVDQNGDGKAELVFSALDPLTDLNNKQVRVGVFSISTTATAGAAAVVSTGPDSGTYVTGKAVADHATTSVPGTGTSEYLALATRSASSGVVYLDPLSGAKQTGGFALTLDPGGVTIDSA